MISVIGTNDLHGQLDRLPVFAGYLTNLRRARAHDGGVLLVDAGDMFQGTLESNLNEGAAVISIYNALDYQAATVGNHEFDFGPVGPASVVEKPGQDPRGALKARLAQARFPFVVANLDRAKDHQLVAWPNTRRSVLLEIGGRGDRSSSRLSGAKLDVAGVKIGLVGVTTEETPRTTMPANFAGLEVAPLADVIAARSAALRRKGAVAVVVLAHAGGRCERFDDPDDLSSCVADEELFRLARALPPGAVDVLVGAHTHRDIAHRVNGIAIIESGSGGREFGRVDLVVDPVAHRVIERRIFPPHRVCSGPGPGASCAPGDYEGAPVVPDPSIEKLTEGPRQQARELREQSLGVTVTSKLVASRTEESALGNLVADLMRAARPACDLALTNGGGLRADLPAGDLTYGVLYQVIPFDNRFATVRMTGRQLRQMVTTNLTGGGGIFSLSGIRVVARCRAGGLEVNLVRDDGRPITDDQQLVVLTNDFLASGGDGVLQPLELPASAITLDSGPTIRDAVAAELRRRGGTVSAEDPALYDPGHRRMDFPGSRPVSCQ